MKKLLSLFSVGVVAAATAFTASSYVSRDSADSTRQPLRQSQGVRLAPGMLKHDRHSDRGNPISEISRNAHATARSAARIHPDKVSTRVSSKASSVQGYCIYSETGADIGWYDVDLNGYSTLKWKRQGSFSPSAGFVRGDEVFSFYQRADNYSGLTDAGLEILDLASGTVKATYPADIYDSLEKVVVLAAYDAEEDEAWVATLDKTGSSYLLQKFDPTSRSYTDLGVPVPASWLDMAWNPADKSLYLFDEQGELKRYDAKAKRFNKVNSLTWDLSDYPHDMVYSPKDEAFLLLVDSYDDSDYACTDALLLPVAGTASYVGTLPGNPQYSILHVSDGYVNASGSKAPELVSWDVQGDALSGSFIVRLPSAYENGASISGKVYIQLKVDGAETGGLLSGDPGSSVTVPVSGTEGVHKFSVHPFTLSDDGRVAGTPLVFDKCLGPDAPAAPANVTLKENMVTWNAVTAGAHGGYVNLSDMKYNVYVDKVLMNAAPVSGTSLSITMPATGTVAHRAEVYAVCGGKTSEPGVSDKFYADGPLSLPVYLGLEEGQEDLDEDLISMFTPVRDALNDADLRGWRYDDQSEHTGGFYCLCPLASSAGENANEWLFLPAIDFTDKDAHYRLSMEVWSGNHYFTVPETYEVAICQRPSPSRAINIREASTIYKGPYFEQSETLFQVPEEGEWYIGIRYASPIGSYRIYARNFRVEKANSSAGSPAAVTDLRSKAGDKGELTAKLTFKMPLVSISGETLASSEVIKAKGVSEAGEAEVTGAPGEAVSMTVPAVQGDNIIKVTTSSDKGEGLLAETTVYCGVYAPSTPDARMTVASDNMSLTIEVTPNELNDKGEYAGPDTQEVTIYRKIGNEWRAAAEIGMSRTWSFNCPDDKQALYMFGVGAKNAAGECEELITFPVHLGPVHQLPMTEPFNLVGEDVRLAYEPVSIEHLSYLQSTWGVTDPAELDPDASNASGTALAVIYDGESQILLPRFSTVGKHNVKVDLSLFFGNLAPENVTVLAASPAQTMTEIASFSPESGSGWEHKLVSLPSSCQNQGWVQIYIRVKIVGYSQCFLMESYSISDYPSEMVTISGFEGASRVAVGETSSYRVELENAGTSDKVMPKYTFKAVSSNGEVAFESPEAPASISAGDKVELIFKLTPASADKGDMTVSFNIEGQPEVAVSNVSKQVKVLNARIPVVDDLALEYGESKSDVVLSWSVPEYVEDFEVAEPWDYSQQIRGFRNLDLDKSKVWTITEVSYPGAGLPKAFQVFSTSVTGNQAMAAHGGEQYLICMSPKTGSTDDWLISPEVKPGSVLSFWLNICHEDYPETVLVKYSTSGCEPSDFTHDLDGGYICPETVGWNRYEFTLPADARYFAIQHIGDDGNEQFGFMIDDIAFEPLKGAPVIEGYNVYRDDDLIASALATPGFVDSGVDTSVPVRYYVKALATVNNERIESDRSNVVWSTELGAVEDVMDGSAYVTAGKGCVILRGFSAGTRFTITDASGVVVGTGCLDSGYFKASVAPGVYVVKAGSGAYKVIVR